MRARLMHPDRDLDLSEARAVNQDELTQDLELDTLVAAMAQGDEVIDGVARTALLCSPPDLDIIRYRHAVLRDCLRRPAIATEMYAVASQAIEAERRIYSPVYGRTPESQLLRSVKALGLLFTTLQRLRKLADSYAADVSSVALRDLFTMLQAELTDSYLASIADHLERLELRAGVSISARLGTGNAGTDFVLRRPRDRNPHLLTRLTTREPTHFTVTVADRDVAGSQALRELRDRGLALVASATSRAASHVLGFLRALRAELAFYVGCLNLHSILAAKRAPLCFPEPRPAGERALGGAGIYDVALALSVDHPVVGSDLGADGRDLILITGANQGGKSTFLRSLGLARMMMQSGMCVGATTFRCSMHRRLFTHYKREEDATLTSGKLDEELARMSDIAGHLEPHCVLLCNESFASTNEREGSEIATQVVRALLDRQVEVAFVTHFYELARSVSDHLQPRTLFLRAERLDDARRTFRMVEGPPEATSYGVDLYRRVFAEPMSLDRPASRPV